MYFICDCAVSRKSVSKVRKVKNRILIYLAAHRKHFRNFYFYSAVLYYILRLCSFDRSMFTENEVNGMLVSQLKEELKTRGASTTGKKAELCARLIELIGTVENENSTENQPSSSNPAEESRGEPTEVPSGSSTGEEGSEEQKPNPKEEELTENSQSQATSFEAEPMPTKEEVKDTDNDVNGQTAASISAPDVEKSSENETKVHVRIDYFQRPLNLKSLIDWLEKQCECSLSLECVWVNAIKTHCYVDFSSHEKAQLCIDNMTGQRYPACSASTFEADFIIPEVVGILMAHPPLQQLAAANT